MVVPVLLLLVARDLLLYDTPRVLAWRLLHDLRLAAVPGWLAPLLPRPSPDLDRDPIALLLGAVASLGAVVYLLAALGRARPARRGALIGLMAVALVAAPSLGFMAMGFATHRPYGQDGGVVQLPLAIDKILSGQSPYGADYSDSILGKEARVSDFWASHGYGGNPILRHHAYLPGTHLLMLPFQLACRGFGAAFDPRLVTLLAWALAMALALSLVQDPTRRLAALAAIAVNPLVYWHQIFGANDMLIVALLLLVVLLAQRQRSLAAAAVLGLACGTKQLAWPFAPFLLVQLAGLSGWRELTSREGLRRLVRPLLVLAGVFLVVVAPVAALDLRRFWADIVNYNVGLPGADNYPLGGTPGFGFANFLIYFGRVASLKDYFPFGVFYVLLVPLGLYMLGWQMRQRTSATALVAGSAALLASLYFSRVVHPNYLVIPAVLLPLGLLMGARVPLDVGVVPLLLFGGAAEIAEHEMYRATWEDGLGVRLPQHLSGWTATLAPRGGAGLAADPLGLGVSGLAAGLGVAYLVAGLLGARPRLRRGLIAAALAAVIVLPTLAIVRIGASTGQVRTQDGWTALAVEEGYRVAGPALPLPPRQAVSTSFRKDPPAVVETEQARGFGATLVGGLLGGVGLRDPRVAVLVALALGLLLVSDRKPEERGLTLLGFCLLGPMGLVDVPLGSSDALLLLGLFCAWRAWRSRRLVLASSLGLIALGLFPRGLALQPGPIAPGLGLPNLFCYWGREGSLLGVALAWLLPWAAAVAVLAAWRRLGPTLAMALALLAALVCASGTSANALMTPLGLILLAFCEGLAPTETVPSKP